MKNSEKPFIWNITKKNSCQSRRDGMFLKATNLIKGAPSGAPIGYNEKYVFEEITD